ncbi:MAG: protein translocase subunit SecD [Trueperella sp.]|nr:protein translocase subunit SecD [Trueperella sp.]
MSSAPRSEEIAPGKRLIVTAILIVLLIGSLIVGSLTTDKARFAPDLALDLEGGTQIILTPITTDGSEVTDSDVKQAIEIIRQRVDASGVAEAEITSQGGSNIIVALPGNPDKATLDLVRTSAVLRMRPVLALGDPNAMTAADAVAALGDKAGDLNAETMTPEELTAALTQLADVNGDGTLSDTPASTPENSSDPAWLTEKVLFDAYRLQCGSQDARISAADDDSAKATVACAADGQAKFLLGPAELEGANIDKAASSLAYDRAGNPTGGWAVNLELDGKGGDAFAEVTGRIYQLESPRNQFAIVLDGQVLSAPVPNGPISGGKAEITGKFTAAEAATLANQLNFGSLPLLFEVQSEEQISATLGTEQLSSGLIAGLVGLGLIVLYMIWQYHALGAVSILSIATSTGLSYLVICLLSWVMGYRLSMAGVLGIIISIGVTADSFIVYFERIRDEMRDGHGVPGGIRQGWIRARRTIVISDMVNLIASVVLFLLTVGSVRGFAFTLGVTTVLDLFVVTMFTYPLMEFLGRTKFFGEGRRGSGVDVASLRKNPSYRGRGNFELPAEITEPRKGTKTALSTKNDPDVLEDYEYPEARFRDVAAGEELGAEPAERATAVAVDDDIRPGESLAQRKARQRRERKAAAATQEQADGEEAK